MRTSKKTLGDCVCPSRGRLFPSPIWLWRTWGKNHPSRCRTALATVKAPRSNAGPPETGDGSHDRIQKGRWEDGESRVLRFCAQQLEVVVSLKLQLKAGQQCGDRTLHRIPTLTSTFTKQQYYGSDTVSPINGQNLLIDDFMYLYPGSVKPGKPALMQTGDSSISPSPHDQIRISPNPCDPELD